MLTKPQIASIFRFIAEVLHEPQPSSGQPETPTPEALPSAGVPAVKRSPGRPKKDSAAPPAEPAPVTPEEAPTPTTAVEEQSKDAPVKGAKTVDELRTLVAPLIKAVRGQEVKAVLNKYAPAGHSGDYTLSALAERPETHASFVQDIETLKM